MNRRTFLRKMGFATAGAAMPQLSYSQPRGKPNIVLILADDLGYECLGCNGGTSYKTPNLDALAATGTRFTHAYAQPLCAPTRLQLMTGQYNFRNYEAFGVLSPKTKTFGHLMKDAGYKTCIAGKWQLYSYNPPDYQPEWRGKGMLPRQSGFDEYCLWHTGHTEDKGSRYADPVVLKNGELKKLKGEYGEDVFVSFVTEFMSRNKSKPFFVYYPMVLTHAPFEPVPQSQAWQTDRGKSDPKNFAIMVEYMDTCIGRLVQSIDHLGLRENTLILFFSDNGTPREIESRMGNRVIRGGKGETTDAGTHVPLIANWQGTTPQGRVIDDLVDSTDFLPTIATAAGTNVSKYVPDGRSFLPQLRGEKGTPRDWVFCHYDPRPGWDKEQFSLKIFSRDRQYKLYSTGEFFDVSADPQEKIAILPEQESTAAKRSRTMLQMVIDTMSKTRPDESKRSI